MKFTIALMLSSLAPALCCAQTSCLSKIDSLVGAKRGSVQTARFELIQCLITEQRFEESGNLTAIPLGESWEYIVHAGTRQPIKFRRSVDTTAASPQSKISDAFYSEYDGIHFESIGCAVSLALKEDGGAVTVPSAFSKINFDLNFDVSQGRMEEQFTNQIIQAQNVASYLSTEPLRAAINNDNSSIDIILESFNSSGNTHSISTNKASILGIKTGSLGYCSCPSTTGVTFGGTPSRHNILPPIGNNKYNDINLTFKPNISGE
ncbi:MAG: hypothetical protein N4A70_03035 [Pelagimonas sp.]|jgi:hypothetical protein|nr:hypothetical protein [Pelagimonas sp.]